MADAPSRFVPRVKGRDPRLRRQLRGKSREVARRERGRTDVVKAASGMGDDARTKVEQRLQRYGLLDGVVELTRGPRSNWTAWTKVFRSSSNSAFDRCRTAPSPPYRRGYGAVDQDFQIAVEQRLRGRAARGDPVAVPPQDMVGLVGDYLLGESKDDRRGAAFCLVRDCPAG